VQAKLVALDTTRGTTAPTLQQITTIGGADNGTALTALGHCQASKAGHADARPRLYCKATAGTRLVVSKPLRVQRCHTQSRHGATPQREAHPDRSSSPSQLLQLQALLHGKENRPEKHHIAIQHSVPCWVGADGPLLLTTAATLQHYHPACCCSSPARVHAAKLLTSKPPRMKAPREASCQRGHTSRNRQRTTMQPGVA
jgi:hypothetical protein